MAGTPFERSRTPLQKWFYAMYLFTTSRHGVPAKELQRQLGVTYKCAWRMGHEIRKYMADTDGDGSLGGHVEIDETYVGGKDRQMGRPTQKNSKKTAVFGMVERDGNLMTHVVPDAKGQTLLPLVGSHIAPGSRLSSDDNRVYHNLSGLDYTHDSVKHRHEQWVKGDTHTQSIEGVWSRAQEVVRIQ